MKTETNRVSYIAKCQDCNWYVKAHWQSTKLAEREISKHVKATFHRVVLRVVTDTVYSPDAVVTDVSEQ